MSHKVYVNYNDVHQYVADVTSNIKDAHLQKWFIKRLTHYLMSSHKSVTELKTSKVVSYFKNKDMPVVIQKALEKEEKIFSFKTTPSFTAKMPQVVDYLNHAKSQSIDITGMTFDKAYEQSEKWHKSFARPKRKRKANVLKIDGLNMLKTFENGCFLAQLVSKEQFQYEGEMMAHCVSSYYHSFVNGSSSKIFTYRTKENKSLLTMEVVEQGNNVLSIMQAKGFANKGFIPEEHIKNVLNYFHKTYKQVVYHDCLIFGHKMHEKPVIIMPKGQVFNGERYETEIEVNCSVGFPENAVFMKTLRLKAAQQPVLKDIVVNGNLIIENSLIVAIADSVQVTGYIQISASLTSIIPLHLQSKIRRVK